MEVQRKRENMQDRETWRVSKCLKEKEKEIKMKEGV